MFCPIMTIGFDPPKKGQRDNRVCKKDCTWYNPAEEKCEINVISERLEIIQSNVEDVSEMISYGEVPPGYDDETKYDNYGFG